MTPEDYAMLDRHLERIADALTRPLVLFQRVQRRSRAVWVERKPSLAVDPVSVVSIEVKERFDFDGDDAAHFDINAAQRAIGTPTNQGREIYSEITLSTGATYCVFGGLGEISRLLDRRFALKKPYLTKRALNGLDTIVREMQTLLDKMAPLERRSRRAHDLDDGLEYLRDLVLYHKSRKAETPELAITERTCTQCKQSFDATLIGCPSCR